MLILGKSSDQIKAYSQEKKGMLLLADDILEKFTRGETSIQEVLRITTQD